MPSSLIGKPPLHAQRQQSVKLLGQPRVNVESARLNSSLEISGWAFDSARQIKDVAAIVSLGTQTRRIVASFPLPRPDVAKARHTEDAALSGFSADGLASLPSADVALEISYSDSRAERVALGRVAGAHPGNVAPQQWSGFRRTTPIWMLVFMKAPQCGPFSTTRDFRRVCRQPEINPLSSF